MTSRALGLTLALVVAGCVTTRNSFPDTGSTPGPVGGGTTAAAAQVIAALSARGLPAAESTRPFRPVEGPLLSAAPRTVLQATLPNDPDHGFIVIYSLASPAAADAAAKDQAAYLRAGIGGGALIPPGTELVLRQLDANVIFFSWLPATAPDPRMAEIPQALAGVGTEVPIGG